MVPRAYVLVHAEARAHHALAHFEGRGDLRADTPLALELALGVGDVDLEPLVGRAHRFAERLRHLADAVGVHRPDPLDADSLLRTLDAHVDRVPLGLMPGAWDDLRLGRGGVAVHHDDEHAVA